MKKRIRQYLTVLSLLSLFFSWQINAKDSKEVPKDQTKTKNEASKAASKQPEKEVEQDNTENKTDTSKIQQYKLPNGLSVILQQDLTSPSVAVNVWYHVGSRHETSGKTGLAHLFEHLMFQGTPHTGEDVHFKYLETAGATSINGTTNTDRTNYYEVIPKEELELALWLESDRMGYLLDGLTQEKLDEQRNVVKNERRQRTVNTAYELAREQLWQQIFQKDHAYHGRVIGSMNDLEQLKLEDLEKFYSKYYAPSNATLAIVGNYNIEKTKSMIEKYFSTLPIWKKPEKLILPVVNMPKALNVSFKEEVGKRPILELYYLTPAIFSKDDIALELIALLLGGKKSSALYQNLVLDEALALDLSVDYDAMQDQSLFTISLVLKDDNSKDAALEAVLVYFEELQALPPEESKLKSLKAFSKTQMLINMQNLTYRSDLFQKYNHFLGRADHLDTYIKELENVTTDDISKVTASYFKKENLAVLFASPTAKTEIKIDGKIIEPATENKASEKKKVVGQNKEVENKEAEVSHEKTK